jgi:hypothetical protein
MNPADLVHCCKCHRHDTSHGAKIEHEFVKSDAGMYEIITLPRGGTCTGLVDTVVELPVNWRTVKAPKQWIDSGALLVTARTRRGIPLTFVMPMTAMETVGFETGERNETKPMMKKPASKIRTMLRLRMLVNNRHRSARAGFVCKRFVRPRHHLNCVSDSTWPSGSRNQATNAPLGACHIPSPS